MSRFLTKFLSGLIAVVLFSSFAYAAEELTITTYYPSPFGSYQKLKTKQLDFATMTTVQANAYFVGANAPVHGTTYFDSTLSCIRYWAIDTVNSPVKFAPQWRCAGKPPARSLGTYVLSSDFAGGVQPGIAWYNVGNPDSHQRFALGTVGRSAIQIDWNQSYQVDGVESVYGKVKLMVATGTAAAPTGVWRNVIMGDEVMDSSPPDVTWGGVFDCFLDNLFCNLYNTFPVILDGLKGYCLSTCPMNGWTVAYYISTMFNRTGSMETVDVSSSTVFNIPQADYLWVKMLGRRSVITHPPAIYDKLYFRVLPATNYEVFLIDVNN